MASSKRNKRIITAFVLAASFGLTACADYLSNRDTVSARAGNANQANTAIQEIQPWPPSAYKTTVGHGG